MNKSLTFAKWIKGYHMKVKKFLKEAGVYKIVKEELKRGGGDKNSIATLMKHETKFVSPLRVASPISTDVFISRFRKRHTSFGEI